MFWVDGVLGIVGCWGACVGACGWWCVCVGGVILPAADDVVPLFEARQSIREADFSNVGGHDHLLDTGGLSLTDVIFRVFVKFLSMVRAMGYMKRLREKPAQCGSRPRQSRHGRGRLPDRACRSSGV